MRRLPKAKRLRKAVRTDLATKTGQIAAMPVADQKKEAERLYKNARKAAWFKPVIDQLKQQAGRGYRCMLCSGSEASDVEHYRPKGPFPLLAFTYENYLWVCTPCNRSKSTRFPPDTEPGVMMLNPIIDDVWNHFFIDKYGQLTAMYDPATGQQDARALKTEELADLNRDALQICRRDRLKDLKEKVQDTLAALRAGKISKAGAKRRVATWLRQPFQPDVADYFLLGPGRKSMPFSRLFKVIT
jgi:hypothetical protein